MSKNKVRNVQQERRAFDFRGLANLSSFSRKEIGTGKPGVKRAYGPGATALCSAPHDGDDATAMLLLQKGLKVKLTNRDGWAPLLRAVARDFPEGVCALLKAGAEVNHTDAQGKTPLDWAIEKERTKIQEILKKAGGVPKRAS